MNTLHSSKAKRLSLIAMPTLAVILATSYLIVRTILFLIASYAWYEKIIAALLLICETFMLVHGIGYFVEILRVIFRVGELSSHESNIPPSTTHPAVAVIVSSFHEPIEVVRNTLVSLHNLKYSNKQVYFLDDTRYDDPQKDPDELLKYKEDVEKMCEWLKVGLFRHRWRGAKAGMINDFLSFISENPPEGSSMRYYKNAEPAEKPKYVAVFDADMNPFPNFLEKPIAIMENEPKLAFIQTPQYYTNFEHNKVARAAGLQQAVFYEYICEGKSIQDAMFCCGTNVLFRQEALMDIGGFDELSVTEDFATSIKFHIKGWSSRYLNYVGAFGMGPEDLGAYFKQQFRWSLGTVGLFRKIIPEFLRNPAQLSFAKWWEYFLSGSYYFIGIVLFILMLCPILFLFFNVPTFFARPEIYAMFFIPYFLMTFLLYGLTLHAREYKITDLILGQMLIMLSFPVHIRGATLGLLGIRGKFEVTNKGGSLLTPIRLIWPQLLMGAAALSSVAWGANRLFYERQMFLAILVNMLWSMYHAIILFSVCFFRTPGSGKE